MTLVSCTENAMKATSEGQERQAKGVSLYKGLKF
jgi:hypothetical protein